MRHGEPRITRAPKTLAPSVSVHQRVVFQIHCPGCQTFWGYRGLPVRGQFQTLAVSFEEATLRAVYGEYVDVARWFHECPACGARLDYLGPAVQF